MQLEGRNNEENADSVVYFSIIIYRIVHQYIKSVHIEYQQFTTTTTVNLVNYLGLDKQLIFDYNSRSKRDKAFTLFGEKLKGYKYQERIKRKCQNYEKEKNTIRNITEEKVDVSKKPL